MKIDYKKKYEKAQFEKKFSKHFKIKTLGSTVIGLVSGIIISPFLSKGLSTVFAIFVFFMMMIYFILDDILWAIVCPISKRCKK